MLDWNDLRFFLAVARTGSTLAASKELRVSQATVSRRVTIFEEAVGAGLFSRSPAGYALTPRGTAMLPAAEAVEKAVDAFAAGIAAETRRLSGEVRLTTVESAANSWVIPALAMLGESHPEIRVEIVTSDFNLDLLRGEADVAIRFGARPVQDALVARHLTDMEECFYASRELASRLGWPSSYADLARYPLVADSFARTGPIGDWVSQHVPGARIAHFVDRLSGVISGVRAGLGAALLPCLMGDDLKGLVRLMPPIPELSTPCWMVTTDAARRQPHIRAVIDCVVAHIEQATRTPAMAERAA